MKKPSSEKVIIVHRPQKPASQERVGAETMAVECGAVMGAAEQTAAQPAQEQQQQQQPKES